jgi:general secretion pathway protein F
MSHIPFSNIKKTAPTVGDFHSSSEAQTIHLRVEGADGQEQILEFNATTQAAALRKAAARGLRVLAVESASEINPATGVGSRVQFPLLLFSQELFSLLEAGLNLTEALSTLHAKEKQPMVRGVLSEILQYLREGKNFSDVLAVFPQYFPDVYVATVRASERTGDLPRALTRYIAYQVQFESIRKKLISTAIYPAMLLIVGGFVTLFLLGYVVPKFSSVYESAGRDIPLLSLMLLGFGKIIFHHWQWVIPGFLSIVAGLLWWISRPDSRKKLLNHVLKLPWLAEKSDEFRLSRFYRAVSLLLASGIALPRALSMVDGLLSPDQQPRIAQARLAVEQGQSLSNALIEADLASKVAESLIKVGERSGQLAEMLERTAQFHDEEFSRWVDWASRLLEPILMTIIGLVIGTVVVLMYMPIFDLAGSLQ